MEAGRELDNLMATEVMEWKLNSVSDSSWEDKQGNIRTWEDTSFKSFRPSTDITAAMELIPIVLRDWDSTKEHNYEAEFGAWYSPDWWEQNQTNRGPHWWAAFGSEWDYEGRHWLYEVHAPELALAICLAVCEAKGIEIEE